MSGPDDLIPAATIILLRDEPAFEVLMVERHANVGFAGGALVFPGGRVDPGDANPLWADRAKGLKGCSRQIAAGKVAAIREAFEETGVLLAYDGESGKLLDGPRAASLGGWRQKIERDDTLFFTLAEQEKLVLACDRLSLFAHWVAPPRLHKRFDTLFFAARAPHDQIITEDGVEAIEALWISPSRALEDRQNGARKIIFPTARNLELLGASNNASNALASCHDRKIIPVQPTMLTRDGVSYLTIPDGLGYPITEELLETALRQ